MKLPKKIKFCGFTYRVKEVERLDGEDNWGRTDMGHQEIFIEKDLSNDRKIETLIHELIHIALRNTGILDKLNKEAEEQAVRAWSLNIFGILKENGILKL